MGRKFLISALSAVCTTVFSSVHAADFSYTGAFATDDEVQLFDFTLTSTSAVTIRTFGYGGGVQSDGNVVSAGGFDPMITIFDSSSIYGGNLDGPSPPVLVDPATGLALDALFTSSFDPGSYTVALTQYGNFARGPTLADGFAFEGVPDFTTFFELPESCSNGQFCSYMPDGENPVIPVNRTNAWALDIVNVASASAVPVPAAAWLFGSGLLGLIVLARRSRL
jgi:hypothetical protein